MRQPTPQQPNRLGGRRRRLGASPQSSTPPRRRPRHHGSPGFHRRDRHSITTVTSRDRASGALYGRSPPQPAAQVLVASGGHRKLVDPVLPTGAKRFRTNTGSAQQPPPTRRAVSRRPTPPAGRHPHAGPARHNRRRKVGAKPGSQVVHCRVRAARARLSAQQRRALPLQQAGRAKQVLMTRSAASGRWRSGASRRPPP